MAPQPKRKHSSRRARVRAQALALHTRGLVACASCKKQIVPHRVCPYCGFYNGRLVVAKKVKKQKEHENSK